MNKKIIFIFVIITVVILTFCGCSNIKSDKQNPDKGNTDINQTIDSEDIDHQEENPDSEAECKKSIISDRYFPVEYIESTGTQYIDTLYSAPNGFIADVVCEYPEGGSGYIIGSHNENSPYGRNGAYFDGNRRFWELGYGESYPQSTEYMDIYDKKINIKFSTISGCAYLIVDGNNLLSATDAQVMSSYNLLIFANQYTQARSSETTKCKLYSLKVIDDNNTTIRDYIPVYDSITNKAGLYDQINKTFSASKVDDFVYGKILYHSFDDGETVKDSTYYSDGSVKYTCSECQSTYFVTIAKTSYSAKFSFGNNVGIDIFEGQDYTKYNASDIAYSYNVDKNEYTKEDAQINFRINILDESYDLKDIIVEGNYKNIKNIDDGIYRITKIKSDLTITIVLGINIEFSHASGFYDDEFDLSITSSSGEIYYTLDGSEPTKDSIKYEGSISIGDASLNPNTNSMLQTTSGGFLEDLINEKGNNSNAYPYYIPGYKSPDSLVDKCTIIKAKAFDDNCESDVITASYFVDFNDKNGYDVNIISIIADPDDLFGYDHGIYVRGKTYDNINQYMQWYEAYWWWWWGNYSLSGDSSERQAYVSFFNGNELILEKPIGIRIHGNGSRGYVMKSINLYARDEYDNQNYFDFDFFGTGYLPQRMTLSSGGDDYEIGIDDYLLSCVSQDSKYSMAKMERYCLFLNGEFWGYYFLSEKPDDEYFEYNLGIDKDNIIFIKNGEIEEGTNDDINLYNQMMSYLASTDLTIESNYQYATSIIDIDSFIDYFATMAYIGRNGDWPGSNFGLYRSRNVGSGVNEDTKWRCYMFDINSGAFDFPDDDWVKYISDHSVQFRHLYRNENFKNAFDNKLVSLAKTKFSVENMTAFIENYRNDFTLQMINQYKRFYGSENSKLDEFNDKLDQIKIFFIDRNAFIMNQYATAEHVHSYEGIEIKAATFDEKGIMRYRCVCEDYYDEEIPILLREDFAYKITFEVDEHVKVYCYVGQNYNDTPIETTIDYSQDKSGDLLKDGDGQINFLVVPDEGYDIDINIVGNYKNLKGQDETGIENVYRITKIKSDLTVQVSSMPI